jgi:hypothetical protein
MDWYCMPIEHTPLRRPLNETFRTLLIDEYAELGQLDNCRIYVSANQDAGYSYYFSPGAAARLQPPLRFWQGVPISEPPNLEHIVV